MKRPKLRGILFTLLAMFVLVYVVLVFTTNMSQNVFYSIGFVIVFAITGILIDALTGK